MRPSAALPAAPAIAAGLLAAALAPHALRAQDAAGPEHVGAFVYAVQGGGEDAPESRLLVVPDTSSTLDGGARLFFRCRGDRAEVYVAVTEGNIGNAKEGAGGQWRFDRRPWHELVQWGANEQGTAAFLPPRFYDTFAARARESGQLEVRIVNLAGVRQRFVFPLDGFPEGARRLGCFGGDEEDGGEG